MADVMWLSIQFIFISIYFYRPRKRLHNECALFVAVLASSAVGMTVASKVNTESGVRVGSQIQVQPAYHAFDKMQKGVEGFSVSGSYAKVGSASDASGTIYEIPRNDCGYEDDVVYSKKPKEWVALYHYGQTHVHEQPVSNDTDCQGMIDRMKNAMMFGASAIIILVMNPKIVRELDIAQVFSRPVILIQTATNVTAIVDALLRHISWKVQISAKKANEPQTVTVWSMCWRSRPGSGVVCRPDSHLSKEDPGHFWNYFFSLLATLILLMILKSKAGDEEELDNLDQGQALRHVAMQALAMMTIKRFKPVEPKPSSVSASTKEICAICLDNFYPRQRLRVLPCCHEFHKKCVDPWLLKQPTCPLCKLDIIDSQLKKGLD